MKILMNLLAILFIILIATGVYFYFSSNQLIVNEDLSSISLRDGSEQYDEDKERVVFYENDIDGNETLSTDEGNLSVDKNLSSLIPVHNEVVSKKKESIKKKVIVKETKKKVKKPKRKLVNKNRKFSKTLNKVQEKTLDLATDNNAKSKKNVRIYKSEIIDIDDMNFKVAEVTHIVKTKPKKKVVKHKTKKTTYKKVKPKKKKTHKVKRVVKVKSKKTPKPKKVAKVKRKKVIKRKKVVKTPKTLKVATIAKPKKVIKTAKKIEKKAVISKATAVRTNKAYYGKKVYARKCKLCHGKSKKFILQFNRARWNQLLVNDGRVLKNIHAKSKVAVMTNKFYNSKSYLEQIASLKDFILKNTH